MSARILPREEWDLLDEETVDFCLTLNPEDVAVVVVEDSGVIVARMVVARAPMWEKFWMASSAKGNAGITRALLRAANEKAAEWSPHWLIAHAEPGPMGDTLERLGGQWLPVHTFMLSTQRAQMEDAACRQQ